jgi:hypothetical protein
MFLVWLFFCTESSKCPGIVSRYIFKPLHTIPVAPMITDMTFLHRDFYILISLQLPFYYTPI